MESKSLEQRIQDAIKQWKLSQVNQTDGYEYERSFDEMMKQIGKDILQESLGEQPKNRKEKKNS
ncbi:hypothetical protein [Ignavibacterium album]|uniref:hypothetical protein n=1 Tax=Ignavibacterium album TaxID=591197 RepID=UPI0035B88A63